MRYEKFGMLENHPIQFLGKCGNLKIDFPVRENCGILKGEFHQLVWAFCFLSNGTKF
jgi:hypothetical protein